MPRILSVRNWAIGLAALALLLSCRSPTTGIQLLIDTDAPALRAVDVEIVSYAGIIDPSSVESRRRMSAMGVVTLRRDANGAGTFIAGGTVGLLPPADRLISDVTVWIRAVFAATGSSPEIRVDRVSNVRFVRGISPVAMVFLPLRCGDQSANCTSVSASECTVSVRCREQNSTCGDLGECVSAQLTVLTRDQDGAIMDSGQGLGVDANAGRIDMPTPPPAIEAGPDGAPDVPCPPLSPTACGGVCVDLITSSTNCGSCGATCPAGDAGVGTPLCVRGQCSLICPANTLVFGGTCIAATLAPRQLAPLSLGDVTQLRPTLRWSLPNPFVGASIDLCRDRACTMLIETRAVDGTSVRPTRDLTPRSVVFWRVRGRNGTAESPTNSPTWLFHVPATSASTLVDTSYQAHTDVNGDGLDDIVVGSPGASPGGRVRAGVVSVYYSRGGGFPLSPSIVLAGSTAEDSFGSTVAGAGDVNGDGFGDVVVGAPNADPMLFSEAGSVSIFHGNQAGLSINPTVLYGVAANNHFGGAIAGAGDVNGDGFADVLIGAPQSSQMGRTENGAVQIFYGSAMGVSVAPALTIAGTASFDTLGNSVASAGDVNGDGFSDVIIGTVGADPPGRLDAGAAAIHLGSATGLSRVASRALSGSMAGDAFGIAVAGAGDLNGDGYSDVAIGASQATVIGMANAGTVAVYQGSPMGTPAMFTRLLQGTTNSDRFGQSVSGAHDVNGDGFGDLVVGAPTANPGGRTRAGQAYLFAGSALGVPVGATVVMPGAVGMELFGTSVASSGDIDGDGFSDILVGSPNYFLAGSGNPGRMSFFPGGMMGIRSVASTTRDGSVNAALFGISLASATKIFSPRQASVLDARSRPTVPAVRPST